MTSLNNRIVKIVNCSLENDLKRELPSDSWVGLIYANESSETQINKLLSTILDSNVTYICCTGEMSELIHDMCDEEIVYREVENLPIPNHQIMTTFNNDLDEQLWFSVYVANTEKVLIDTVIILDMTNGINRDVLDRAILKIQNEPEKST